MNFAYDQQVAPERKAQSLVVFVFSETLGMALLEAARGLETASSNNQAWLPN
jgi:hypothetical protein